MGLKMCFQFLGRQVDGKPTWVVAQHLISCIPSFVIIGKIAYLDGLMNPILCKIIKSVDPHNCYKHISSGCGRTAHRAKASQRWGSHIH